MPADRGVSRRRRAPWPLACALALVFCIGLLGARAAWAHAALVASTPAGGTVLAQPPTELALVFSEPVHPVAVRVFGPDGDALAGVRMDAQGARLQVGLPTTARVRGSYLLSWRVVSADGHPVSGVLDYAVGAASARPVVPDAGGGDHRVVIWLARWLTYACVIAVAGAALFRPAHRADTLAWTRPWAVAGLGLLLLDLALQGLDLVGVGWGGLGSGASWSAALASSYAWTLAFLALALLMALSAGFAPGRANLWLAAGATPLLVAGAFALSGHASTAPPRWLARPVVALHVLTVLAWMGSLVPLARALAPGPRDGAPDLLLLARYSAAIPWVVALLVASGIVLIGLQVDRPSDLWRSDYGRVLLAKLALVALLLLLAAVNRWRWTAPVLAGSRPALRALRRAMGGELVLAAAVLAVVALWRFTPPPRAADAAQVAQAGAGLGAPLLLQDDRLHARIVPGTGSAPWTLTLQTPQGKPFQAQDVTLVLANEEAGIGALRIAAGQVAPGRWQATVPALPPTGHWQPALVVLVDDFDQLRLSAPAPTHAGGMHEHGGH